MQTTDEIPLRSNLTSRLVASIVTGLPAKLWPVWQGRDRLGGSWTTAACQGGHCRPEPRLDRLVPQLGRRRASLPAGPLLEGTDDRKVTRAEP